ncbi:unnamed protein product [Rhizoctonia solani]|uniref:DUF7918 domain-containing protein n=1 Tax=Rhizoctonia solani TaxID=456999 RepID=A0A8H2X467_9AGAM|nr:unnamed protein product [Rhizoctonia solani]
MIDEGILVWIENTDGEIYNEYEYMEPKPGRKECWIESKQSQNFRICWRFGGTTPHSIKSYIWLDGIQVSGGLLRSYEVHHTFRMSGCAIGSRKRLPFVFGGQQLTDDESSSSNLTNLDNLNTIRIAFEYVTFIGYTMDPPTPPKSRGAIHEKIAKAAPGVSVGLGDPIPAPSRRWCKTEKVPGLDRVVFVFHYAPYEWLLAKEIVSGPRPESPEKRKSPERRTTNVPPSTPRKRKHTLQEPIVYLSDSDSDSDVVVVDEGIAETPKATRNKAGPYIFISTYSH